MEELFDKVFDSYYPVLQEIEDLDEVEFSLNITGHIKYFYKLYHFGFRFKSVDLILHTTLSGCKYYNKIIPKYVIDILKFFVKDSGLYDINSVNSKASVPLLTWIQTSGEHNPDQKTSISNLLIEYGAEIYSYENADQSTHDPTVEHVNNTATQNCDPLLNKRPAANLFVLFCVTVLYLRLFENAK